VEFNEMRRAWVSGAWAFAGLLAALPAQGALDFGANVGIGASDNITLAPENEIDEEMVTVGAGIAFDYQGRRLESNILGSLAYLEYLDDTFDSELVGNVAFDTSLHFIPQRFSWQIEDNFGQVRRNPTEPNVPTNRENINYLSTGPDFTLPIGDRTAVLIGARYSDAYYEESDADSESVSATLALMRSLTRATRLSLNVSGESTEYDAIPGVEFEEYEAYVNYTIEAARTTLAFDVGYTELRFDDESSDGYLARLTVARQLGRASMLTFSAGREFSNSADELRRLQSGDGAGDTDTQPLQGVAGPFTSTYGTLDWAFALNRTELGAGASYFEEDYELTDLFNRARASRQITRTLTLRGEATYGKEQYDALDREFSETEAEVALDWRIGRRVYASLMYRWIDRSDDVPANEFKENQVWLLFGFSRNGTAGRLGRAGLPTMRQSGSQ
jgi:hypothetical protein